jgi:hypothetical protein
MTGITALYVSMLYLVLHRHAVAFALLATAAATAVILYFTWYKHLPPPAPEPMEEADTVRSEGAAAGGGG